METIQQKVKAYLTKVRKRNMDLFYKFNLILTK